MVEKITKSVHRVRHFWRYATFSEVGILYISRIMRVFAVHLTSSLTLIFLYKLGYPIWFLAFYMLAYYVAKMAGSFIGGYYVAKHGPKHGMLLANILYIPMLILTSQVEKFGVGVAILGMVFQAFSVSINNIAYNIDFSKVKTVKRAGRQLGFAYILERMMDGIAPILGGFLAMWLGADKTMLISAVIFLLAAIPLVATKEPIKTNQKINFRGFPWKNYKHLILIVIANGMVGSGLYIWSFFASVFVMKGFNPYGASGVLASISSVSAIIAAILYGKFIDKSQGGKIIKITGIIQTLNFLIRAGLIFTPVGAVISNIINQMAMSGYNMANMKGMFDEADESGARVVYMLLYEIGTNFVSILSSVALLIIVHAANFTDSTGELAFRIFLALMSLGIPAILFVNYRVYRPQRRQFKE